MGSEVVVEEFDDDVADDAAELLPLLPLPLPLPLLPPLLLLPPSQLGRCGGLLEPKGPLMRQRPPVATASPKRTAPRARVGNIASSKS